MYSIGNHDWSSFWFLSMNNIISLYNMNQPATCFREHYQQHQTSGWSCYEPLPPTPPCWISCFWSKQNELRAASCQESSAQPRSSSCCQQAHLSNHQSVAGFTGRHTAKSRHTHTHTHTNTNTNTNTHTNTHTHTQTHTHTFTHTCSHTNTHKHTRMQTHTLSVSLSLYLSHTGTLRHNIITHYTHTYTYTHAPTH